MTSRRVFTTSYTESPYPTLTHQFAVTAIFSVLSSKVTIRAGKIGTCFHFERKHTVISPHKFQKMSQFSC